MSTVCGVDGRRGYRTMYMYILHIAPALIITGMVVMLQSTVNNLCWYHCLRLFVTCVHS